MFLDNEKNAFLHDKNKIPENHRTRDYQQEHVGELLVAMRENEHHQQVDIVRHYTSEQVVASVINVAHLEIFDNFDISKNKKKTHLMFLSEETLEKSSNREQGNRNNRKCENNNGISENGRKGTCSEKSFFFLFILIYFQRVQIELKNLKFQKPKISVLDFGKKIS